MIFFIPALYWLMVFSERSESKPAKGPADIIHITEAHRAKRKRKLLRRMKGYY